MLFQLFFLIIAKTNNITKAINKNDQQMQGLHEEIAEIKGKFFERKENEYE